MDPLSRLIQGLLKVGGATIEFGENEHTRMVTATAKFQRPATLAVAIGGAADHAWRYLRWPLVGWIDSVARWLGYHLDRKFGTPTFIGREGPPQYVIQEHAKDRDETRHIGNWATVLFAAGIGLLGQHLSELKLQGAKMLFSADATPLLFGFLGGILQIIVNVYSRRLKARLGVIQVIQTYHPQALAKFYILFQIIVGLGVSVLLSTMEVQDFAQCKPGQRVGSVSTEYPDPPRPPHR